MGDVIRLRSRVDPLLEKPVNVAEEWRKMAEELLESLEELCRLQGVDPKKVYHQHLMKGKLEIVQDNGDD